MNNRQAFYELMKNVCKDGFPVLDKDIYYFRLPSQGSHPAVHFVWKGDKSDPNIEEENNRIIVSLREQRKVFYSKASRKLVKEALRRTGVVKPHKAEYVIRNLLGDVSAPINESQANILERLSRYVELGEDIISDLRENNGEVPKYDDFWDIVDHVIKTKTGVDDRRHSAVSEYDEVVVNIAMAPSLAHIYRECEHLAKEQEPAVSVPTYPWCLHQFWPTTRSKANITQYSGRFKIKGMVQARVLRKHNFDSHYTNAVYSSMNERAVKYREDTYGWRRRQM